MGALYLMQQSSATANQRRGYFRLVSSTDGMTPITGATGTGFLSKNGAAAVATTNSIVEIDAGDTPGRYYIELTQAELDTVGIYQVTYDNGSSLPSGYDAMVIPDNPFSAALTGNQIAEALLKLDLTTVTGEAARSVLNAIRMLRNRKSVNVGTNTVTVYEEDDTTVAFTIVYSGTDPVITDADPT